MAEKQDTYQVESLNEATLAKGDEEAATEHADAAKTRPLKLDKNGLPMVPQPSDHKDDPLVRSRPPYS